MAAVRQADALTITWADFVERSRTPWEAPSISSCASLLPSALSLEGEIRKNQRSSLGKPDDRVSRFASPHDIGRAVDSGVRVTLRPAFVSPNRWVREIGG
jgi:hypothetical protein